VTHPSVTDILSFGDMRSDGGGVPGANCVWPSLVRARGTGYSRVALTETFSP
jgi:hypothetical protein